MRVTDSPIPDIKIVDLTCHGDARGFFIERFHAERYAELGLPTVYVQDNHSRSAPGIIRGLHYQHAEPQGKLVGVTRGKIFDVAVDIRPNSPTFGRHFAMELSDTNAQLLWIPPGFAHGFCAIGDELADVLYKVTTIYNPAGEGGIRHDDPDFGIQWPTQNPILSARDKTLPSFAEYRKNPPVW